MKLPLASKRDAGIELMKPPSASEAAENDFKADMMELGWSQAAPLLQPGPSHDATASAVGGYLVAAVRHSNARLDSYESRDEQQNRRAHRSANCNFAFVLLGGTTALVGAAVMAAPALSGRKANHGEAVAAFALTVTGSVIAGIGAGLSFCRAAGQEPAEYTIWKRGGGACYAGLMYAAGWLQLGPTRQQRILRQAETAALLRAWTLVAAPEHQVGGFMDEVAGKMEEKLTSSPAALARLKKAVSSALEKKPEPTEMLGALTFAALRRFSFFHNLGDIEIEGGSLAELKHLGLGCMQDTQETLAAELKSRVPDLFVRMPTDNERKRRRDSLRRLGTPAFGDDGED